MSIFEAPQYIPAEIISELESKFGSLDFTNYGTIDDETSSRKLDYRLVEELDPSVSGMMVAMSTNILSDTWKELTKAHSGEKLRLCVVRLLNEDFDKQHSFSGQIRDITNSFISYMKLRDYVLLTRDGVISTPLVFNQVTSDYVVAMVSRLRAIMLDSKETSFGRLALLLKKKAHLFTREEYVTMRSGMFEWRSSEVEWRNEFRAHIENGNDECFCTGAWEFAKRAHEDFDKMIEDAGGMPTGSREECVPDKFWASLHNDIERYFRDFVVIANNEYAHKTFDWVIGEKGVITFELIERCITSLIKVYVLLENLFSERNSGVVALRCLVKDVEDHFDISDEIKATIVANDRARVARILGVAK